MRGADAGSEKFSGKYGEGIFHKEADALYLPDLSALLHALPVLSAGRGQKAQGDRGAYQ